MSTTSAPSFRKLAAILMTGVTMVVFDSTIVNVGLGTIAHHLHTSVSTAQWTISGYILALGMVVPLAGWASRRFGAKQTWIAGLGLFAVGSILSSTAWNIDALIAFRVVQGAGGGLLLPLLQTLLVRGAGDRSRSKVMAAVSVPMLAGPILGPVIGGLIIDHLSWRWMFWINVPLTILGIALAVWGLESTPAERHAHLDLPGLLLLCPGLAGLIYGVTELGAEGGLPHRQVLVPLAVGGALVAAFVLYALRAARPLLDLSLFRNRTFTASSILLFLSGLSLYGALLLLPLWYQQVRGEGVVTVGLLLVPQGIGSLLTRSRAARAIDQYGTRTVVVAGFLLVVLGTVAFAAAGAHTPEWLLALSLVVRGAGLGAITITVMAGAYDGVPAEQIADASSVTRILQQVGGSFGTAVMAAVLASGIGGHHAGGAVTAFHGAFWWSLGLSAVAVIPALLLPGRSSAPDVAGSVEAQPVPEQGEHLVQSGSGR